MITTTVSDNQLAIYYEHMMDLWYSPPNGPAYWATDRQWTNDSWLTDAPTLTWVLSEGGVESIPEQTISIAILNQTTPDEEARAYWNDATIDVIIVRTSTSTVVFGRIDQDGMRFTEDGTWVKTGWSMQHGQNTDTQIPLDDGSWATIVEHLDPDR